MHDANADCTTRIVYTNYKAGLTKKLNKAHKVLIYFMGSLMSHYRSLIGVIPHRVAESPTTYYCLTERHIQALWLEQKYFKQLKTHAGLPVRVISSGIWNAEAGPDFLKAHLEIGGTVVKGDVEIHLSEESWTQHQHHTDPRYNGVVLHLSFWNPKKEISLQTESHQTFHRAYLESFLTVSPNRLVGLIDLDLYPYRKFLGSGQCSQQLFKNLNIEKTTKLFNDAASWRLEKKLDYLKSHTTNPRLWLGVGLATALGYKRNSTTFLDLYLWLHGQKLVDSQQIFAVCLKACGFFSTNYQKKWSSCEYYKALLNLLPANLEIPVFKIDSLKTRPFNHPVRRLAFLALFLADVAHYSLKERLSLLWEQNWKCLSEGNPFSKLRQQFIEALPCYKDDFFNHHYIFGGKFQSGPLPLLGQNTKETVLINAFLPILSESIAQRNQSNEKIAFQAFFASFPAEKTSKTEYLTHRFFGDSQKNKLLVRADLEQGAYQIHKDFCTHYEASCSGCPFVDRYKAHY